MVFTYLSQKTGDCTGKGVRLVHSLFHEEMFMCKAMVTYNSYRDSFSRKNKINAVNI